MRTFDRRGLLATSAFIVFSRSIAKAGVIQGAMPWRPAAGAPPRAVMPGPWQFFTPLEARVIEAIVDRLIPPDSETPGGKDIGCAVYIDRQLAGPFGRAEGLYNAGPFKKGTKQQGPQSPLNPGQQYRKALAGIDAHCRRQFGQRGFVDLDAGDKDAVIASLENGDLKLEGLESNEFFEMLLKNTREGFFGDPIYGGNIDMAAWRMIGFPGARYDYSDWIDRHNQRYPHPPIGIMGAPSWSPR
jgi:gluconate 2-dehydrogenase gamma chain